MKIVCGRFFLKKYMYMNLHKSSKFQYKYFKYSIYNALKILQAYYILRLDAKNQMHNI